MVKRLMERMRCSWRRVTRRIVRREKRVGGMRVWPRMRTSSVPRAPWLLDCTFIYVARNLGHVA